MANDAKSKKHTRRALPLHASAPAQASAPSFILRGALSQTEAARELGIANRTLSDWQREHEIWRPAVSKPRFCLYPLRQIELLQAVMLGAITDDDAWAQWSSVLAGIAMNARKGA